MKGLAFIDFCIERLQMIKNTSNINLETPLESVLNKLDCDSCKYEDEDYLGSHCNGCKSLCISSNFKRKET